ncbi:isoprenylcysteine carboxylmethyltransferase family protein [Streptomyces sp. NBC_00160]|uniref:methyltransferase family protein n=1 Tax=Streptomyces sp. NBC_00160 TaxID=2903628 RepID=UPI00224D5695|nr:isoprenylcysteine carboxylmethyltransferase family protein [Streptomyces sp. NBC_00160]MCX5302832.1 isoprenylcysteine carboxylmethyltransferase family protein [Streptomyces sp. NBC_00160]
MAVLALVLFGAFLLLAGVARICIQYRRTGDTGIRRARAAGPAHAWARAALATASLLVGIATPVAELVGVLDAVPVLDRPALHAAGAVLALAGIGAVILAQNAMGASWRNDVDPTERTALITHGPFRLVRNPIYTAALTWATGLALLVPNPLALPGLLLLLFGLELQVRYVEEPYLRRTHGPSYEEYAARTGRFLPGLGRTPRTRPA